MENTVVALSDFSSLPLFSSFLLLFENSASPPFHFSKLIVLWYKTHPTVTKKDTKNSGTKNSNEKKRTENENKRAKIYTELPALLALFRNSNCYNIIPIASSIIERY